MDGLELQSTYVLLIGESDYPNWPQMNIPNVQVNLKELADVLSDPDYCGIPQDRIKIIKDEDLESTSSAIYDFFDGIQTKNTTIIFYYSGHGLQSVKAMDDLFLATRNIRENKFEPSAIKISELRKLFSDCPAARKILLLDCCYAGKITKGFLGDDASDTVAKLNEFEGTYIMAASSEFERARFDPNDPSSPTKFTGKFVDVIKNGIDCDDEYCTLNSIYNEIKVSFLTEKDAPKPVQVEQNNIADFPLFKNKKFLNRKPDEREWNNVLKRNNTIAYYKFKEQFPDSVFVKEADKKINELEYEDAWQKAKARDTIGAYNSYIENYQDSTHVADAKKRLAELTLIEQASDDENDFWMKVRDGNTVNLYKAYTEKYPSGKFVDDALSRIKGIQQQEKEEGFWKKIIAQNQLASYKEYLKMYPAGVHADEAKSKVEAFQKKTDLHDTLKKNFIEPTPQKTSGSKKFIWVAGILFVLIMLIYMITLISNKNTYKSTKDDGYKDYDTEKTNPIIPLDNSKDTNENYNFSANISVGEIYSTVKYDVFRNNQKGMEIYPHFTINNAMGQSGIVSAYFYYSDQTTPLKDYNKLYYTTAGNVSTWENITPSYETTVYNGSDNVFTLFIPYEELGLNQSAGNSYKLSFYVSVFINNKEIKNSGWTDFQVSY